MSLKQWTKRMMVATLLVMGFAHSSRAADGDLDATFGSGGKVTTDFGSTLGVYDGLRAVAVQSDGKIVAAGYAYVGSLTYYSFALVRFNTNGTLDSTFGTGGKVSTDFGGATSIIYGIALQQDGKIVVGGIAKNVAANNDDVAIARYNSDGTLDSTFGTAGKAAYDFGNTEGAYAMTLQSDGKVVAAGFLGSNTSLFRFKANGTLDTAFGTLGAAVLDLGGGANYKAVAMQSDGKIIGGGYKSAPTSAAYNFILTRYNSDGTLDSTFGSGGVVNTDLSGADRVHALAIQRDGKIIAGGVGNSPYDMVLARYNTNGTLDNTFGTGGKVFTDFGGSLDNGWALVLQNDDKIILGGEGGSGTLPDFAMARYLPDGTLDSTFGVAGKVMTDFSSDKDHIYALALQSDNKIAAAGIANDGARDRMALARYTNTDLRPSLTINDSRSFSEGSSAAPGSTTFAISLSAASTQIVSVHYQTADGVTYGAKSGSDYVAKSGTLTFAAGETTKYVKVTFIGDAVAEFNEPFFLDIKTPVNATIADSRGSTYIKNDDGPSVSIANALTVAEGDSGTTPQTFTVTLSAPSTQTILVSYTTANGTAGPADYVMASGALTFNPGETSKIIIVPVKGDTTVEPTETYKVNLFNSYYAVLADSQGVGYIRNDDTAPILLHGAPSE